VHRRVGAALLAITFSLAISYVYAPPALAGGGCHGPRTEAQTNSVLIEHLCFSPMVVHVTPGTTVRWTNRDPLDHTVTGGSGSFGDYEVFGQDKGVSHRFDQPGTYPYFCALHPTMVGAVVVGDGAATAQRATSVRQTSRSGGGWWWVIPAIALAFAAVAGSYVLGRRSGRSARVAP
jgi:plastocyanin